jgi:dynein heavy chain
MIAKETNIVHALEKLVKNWTDSITKAQDQLTNYPKNITSAMMEIDNRKRAVSNWSILAQQLKSDNIKRIVNILLVSDESQKGKTFQTKITEFEKTFEDANDYLKFLQTLERSIKDLSSDDLATIEHSIAGIFHNLKIIWMISKHKDPNKFGFLLEVMAKEIWMKISEKIKLKELFKTNPDEIDQSIALITQANRVASQWIAHYSDTKNKTKWEYAHNKITKDLEYVKTICGRLKNGLLKIKGFLKFLGHDLERVIGGASERIYKEKEKVMKAYSYIENYQYNIFNSETDKSCTEVFQLFDADMQSLEQDTKKLIDDTFDNLKNAESAFDLYTNFDSLIDQTEIKSAMKDKYINILKRFILEVKNYGKIFEDNKANPPISKAKSETAGKIAWARQLYVKMKRPISKIFQRKDHFKQMADNPKDDKLATEKKLADAFLEVAKKLREYELEIFEQWKANCLAHFMGYLRLYVLIKKGNNYEVNFDNKLKLMIHDTKFLDLYGFSDIPPNIINIAHQETQLAKYCNILNLMLRDYDNLTKSMKDHHHMLLNRDSNELLLKIEVGTNTHNWTALGIEEFYRDCMNGIKNLRDKFANVIKSEEKILSVIKQISNATLVRELDKSQANNRELNSFLFFYEEHRQKIIGDLMNKYHEITLTLVDIERLTFESSKDDAQSVTTKTKSANMDKWGERKEMVEYYHYWESCLLNALSKCILKAIITLNELFTMDSNSNNYTQKQKEQNALFVVKSRFITAKEIMYNPNSNEIDLELKSRLISSFQNTGREFIRWMAGTCKPPNIEYAEEKDKEYIRNNYSYGTEISSNLDLKTFINQLYNSMGRITTSLDDNKMKYIREYAKEYFGHWGQNARAKFETELEMNKTLKNFEKKVSIILFNLDEFQKKREPKKLCNGNFMINNEELISRGKDQIRKVLNDMLKILAKELEDEDMKKFSEIIKSNKEKLMEKTDSSDELKRVLGYVSKINGKKMSMELKMHTMQEKIHFLKLHNYPGLSDIEEKYLQLKKEWENLRVKAKRKDDNLLERKRNLSKNTERDAQLLEKDVKEEFNKYNERGPLNDIDLPTGYTILMESYEKLNELKQRKDDIVGSQKLFNLPITTFPEINDMYEKNAKVEPIYKAYHEFEVFFNDQQDKTWSKLEVPALEKKNEELLKLKREFDRKGLSSLLPYKKYEDVRENYNDNLKDIIMLLKAPVVNERNFGEFIKENRPGRLTVKFDVMTLRDVMKLDLLQDKDKVATMVNDAKEETDVKNKLDEIKVSLDELKFQISPHKRGTEDKGYKFKDVTGEMDIIKDNIENLQNVGANKHAKAFKNEIEDLEQEMNNMMEIIEIWVEVQKKWIYLESIFVGSEDIRQKLVKETQEFDIQDKNFKKLMTSVYKKPSVRFQCREKDRKFELKGFLTKFELAEKALTKHLDSKKNEFSRFYFLTEQDLLQILGSSDPLETLNPHLVKIYSNCKKLLSDRRNITGMVSQEGEKFLFEKPIRIESQQQVGQWMNRVDDEMKNTLRSFTKTAIQDYTKEELYKFIHNKLGMICVFTSEAWWTFALEDVFRRIKQEGDKYAMKKELERQSQGLLDLVIIVRRKDITKEDRLKVNNLIIRTVHGREIVDKFVRDSILDAREFEWESQLKFYWDKEKDDLIIRQCNGEFYSCYEYQGLEGRLVVTPLTDRCVMTLTTALTFFLGCAPAGPAGTGKTETVKDLGKGIGIRVVVQNCSDTLDYLFMGQFFSGLSQTGFWGCFDEFNMINREVLSVVTTQISSIQLSLAQHKESWFLMTKEVKLLPTIGIFITMNPNYEGRSELPDNLKALFRPVTMVVPDFLLICENILLSFGFAEGRKLATKITKLYELSQEQLSKQHHYEWGLRSMKAVLSSAGTLKRENLEMQEDLILMKAMKDLNMPKFIKDDAILFEGLLKDLFPDLDSNQLKEEGEDVVKEIMKTMGLKVLDGQVLKVLQMYEVMNIRHCTMICGPPMAGKSVIVDILRNVFQKFKNVDNMVTYLINPKAQSVPRLYGKKNEISDDFEIGILSNIFQIANAPIPNNKSELRWIILDGDVDPLWIEKLNSVMDDSKQLTLENKDRILMQKYCSLLVEAFNIHHASPATVSRLGMIYVDQSLLHGDAVFFKWIEAKDPKEWDESIKGYMNDNFNRVMPACLKYILKGAKGNEEEGIPFKLIVPQYEAAIVNQLTNLLDSCLCDLEALPSEASQIESLFIFCVVWSVGACLTSNEDREKFAKFIKDLPSGTSTPPSKPYDSCWDISGGRFLEWDSEALNDLIIPENDGHGQKYNEIIIPTSDTKKYSWLLKNLIKIHKPILFVGESGTGKTVTVQNYLKFLTKEKNSPYVVLNMNFSSRTNSTDFQNTMEEILETRFLRTMGPPSGKELLIYVDDLGMPKVDRFETQQPIAFMKLLIEKKCYYTKDNKDLIKLIDTNFIGSTLPPGGGNNNIDPRFIALFNVFNVNIDNNAVSKIYQIILSNYLDSYPEDSDVAGIKDKLIAATVQLFTGVKAELPRTPIKFHYVFNIRDISKVFQGFCLLTQEAFPTKESLIKLWRHEALRVFSDKLREPGDQKKVEAIIENNIRNNFPDQAEYALENPCLHADFMKVNFYDEEIDPVTKQPNIEIRNYENIETYDKVKKFLDTTLEAYKDLMGTAMNLVFYDECVDHLLRIHRILRIENGNALLVGVGGSGKQSLSKLATFIARYELWGIKITSKFEEKHFREQLLELFRKFIPQGRMKPVTFLFTDEQVLDEGFLELINNILTTGIVPAIFEKGEKNQIIDAYKPLATKLNLPETKDTAYNLFVQRIRENLHMIISMSPSGDNLRNRCRNFPGLISSTTIDWFFEWPREALLQVSQFLFSTYHNVEQELVPLLCEHIIGVHQSLAEFSSEAYKTQKRNIYTTPKNFLDYIKNFQSLYTKHFNDTQNLISHLENGLQVLADSSKNINNLKKTVGEEEAKSALEKEKLDKLIVELGIASEETAKNKAIAEEKEITLTEQNKVIAKDQIEIEQNVQTIGVLIESIKEEVSKIDQKQVDMMSKLQRFEGDTIIVKALVFTIKDTKTSWDGMADSEVSSKLGATKKLFSDLIELDATYRKINDIKQCEIAYNRVKDIKVDKSKNKVLAQLQSYVINFWEFVSKSKKRDILQDALNKKIKEKEIAEKELSETKTALAKLTADSERLQKEKDEKEKECAITAKRLAELRQRLSTANSLFDGLKSEQVRWTEDKENLGKSKDKLIGDCLLGAAFLSYCGPFSYDFRKRMIYETWKGDIKAKNINMSDTFTVQGLLTTEQEISQWNIDGLPDDELSTQNGILTENASRWPLAIDPENQAILWLKKKSGDQLKVLTFNSENYMKYVGLRVHNGGTILIENVGDTIDPNINPVLEKNYIIKNQVEYIILDGQEQSVSADFKLFLVTKLPNPHYTPEIMAKTTIINFSITMDGLEEQLLNEVVRFEYPSIEETRKSLVESMNKNKIILKKCESDLLKALNDSAGTDILENTVLIDTLKNTKDKAQELKASLQASETTRKDLYLQRANYIPVAKRGAILYFAISGLRLISSMYEYSLASYVNVYRNAIKEAPPNMILNNRLDSIKKKLTILLYEYICLSIFGRHKLMFSFHMWTMIMRYEEDFNMNELQFFLRGSISEAKNEKPAELDWVSDTSWQDLEGMSGINDLMKSVAMDFQKNPDEWKKWYDLEKPEDTDLPNGFDMRLSPLEKLVVIRVFRKDRVFNAIKNFIKISTGTEIYITPPPMKMNKIFDQSSVNTPVLFILSPGVDPSYYVNQYAIERGYFEKKYRFMSLGQKQETEAKNMIMDGIKRGLWILLQNCDLLFKWLKELENIIDSIDSMKPKPEFRLWLTTSPMPNFPIGILHKSFKVVTEPPDGLGPNMNRVFGSMKPESFETESSHDAYKPLVFVISFFHSVLQDRKKFGKIGWNVVYDFMESDFTISKRLLAMYLNKIGPDDPIPWASLKYLIGEAMYGGRVTDNYDRRVMNTYLNEYMGDFIFDVNQKFFFARSDYDYEIPENGPFDNYVKAINEMPNTYSPEIIGLHSNAEIDYFTQASKRIWEDMLKLQSSTGSSSSSTKKDDNAAPAKTREEIVLEMAQQFLESKVPPKFDMLAINKKFSGGKSPIEAVLTQELERYNMLNDTMRESLDDLISSLKGEIAMNAEIESVMLSLYNGLLPTSWRALAPETQKSLLNWLDHYKRRHDQYEDWLENGEPKVMWLSGLHIPASYLKAIIQITCRKKGWPLDKVSTYTVVTSIYNVDEIKEKPEFGCFIQGLYLEGAEWNVEKNCLERQFPKKLVCDMPLIQVIPAEASKIKLRNNLKTPVYVTQNRNNVKGEGFVFEADLRTLVHPNLWILQGVALLLNTMYG